MNGPEIYSAKPTDLFLHYSDQGVRQGFEYFEK